MEGTLGRARTSRARAFLTHGDDRVRRLASRNDLVPKDPVEAFDSLLPADDGDGDGRCREDLLLGAGSSRTPASSLSVFPTGLSGGIDGRGTGSARLGLVLASKSQAGEAFFPSSGRVLSGVRSLTRVLGSRSNGSSRLTERLLVGSPVTGDSELLLLNLLLLLLQESDLLHLLLLIQQLQKSRMQRQHWIPL